MIVCKIQLKQHARNHLNTVMSELNVGYRLLYLQFCGTLQADVRNLFKFGGKDK